MQTLAVAAISARAMAEAAARDGFGVVALDLFGDVDTRRAASRWLPIGSPESLQIDAARVLDALRSLARERDSGAAIAGWVAGSGFEGAPDLLEQGASVLPLIGTAAEAVGRVRDPASFFGFLAERGMPHPPIRFDRPADPAGWLMKDADGCGGWHVRRAPWPADERPSPRSYYQREMPGQPMSATFIANGREAHVLGFNLLSVRRFGDRPFVFCGAIGPVPLAPGIAGQVTGMAGALAEAFSLRGLCSLDFVLDGEAIAVLEVNPRPPASMSLYPPRAGASGLMQAHVDACLHGRLPAAASSRAQDIEGMEIVFARRPVQLDAAAAERLAAWPGIRDLPDAGQRFDADAPLCTLSARAGSVPQLRTLLAEGREQLLQTVETLA